MKFEINVKNKACIEKLALVKQLKTVLGIGLAAAKGEIADKIFSLLENGVESASIIVDSEMIEMKPLFSIQKNIPLYEDSRLGLTINFVAEPKGLDLCELLKNCIGMTFYMPLLGIVVLDYVTIAPGGSGILSFTVDNEKVLVLGSNGKYCDDGELSVFPSKEQRDWSIFVPPWMPKKGERVWVRKTGSPIWFGKYFVRMHNKEFACGSYQSKGEDSIDFWDECVSFNEIPW